MRTGDRDTFNLPDIPSVDSVSSVTVYVYAMKSADANPSPKIKIMIRTYGTDYYSGDISLSTSYTLYSYNWATNPNTGLSWTADEVNALEAGVRHSTETSLTYGVFRVAQVYVEVTYKLPTTTSTSLSASTITLGGSVTDTATVTPAAATGQVTFYVKAPGGSWAQFGAVKTLSAGSATSDSYTPTSVGTWYFKAVYSGDDNYLGSESDETAEPLTVEPPLEPPVASFTESAETVTVGDTISFDASASSDPDGTIESYSWDFGDGTTGTDVTTTHAYAAAGTYTVTLTVTDNDGLTDTATATKTITPPKVAPVASFTESAEVVVAGTPINFDPSGSYDLDETIVLYEWDWESDGVYDQRTTTPDPVSHTYTTPGTYTVTLRVTDDDGLTDTATATKTVEPIPSGPGIPEFSLSATIITSIAAAIYLLTKRRRA